MKAFYLSNLNAYKLLICNLIKISKKNSQISDKKNFLNAKF